MVAGCGWNEGVVGFSTAVDNTTPQGNAFVTTTAQVCSDVEKTSFKLPHFYAEHGICSTVDVPIASSDGQPFGVLEVDSRKLDAFDETDIDFITGFANVLAEAVATNHRSQNLQATIKHMQKLIEDKETLSQELKHRVRNSLHLVYGLLSAELDANHDPNSLIAFRSIALRVLGLAQVFDHLLGIGMSRVINFGDYISALCGTIPELYKQDDVHVECHAQPIQVNLTDATALGIIATELVNNAYLHAFPTNGGIISVILSNYEGAAELRITDNGVGFSEAPTHRRGLRLARRLIDQVGGTIELESSDNGSLWIIRFPLPAITEL
jgi:two-component sensor histidine kinase